MRDRRSAMLRPLATIVLLCIFVALESRADLTATYKPEIDPIINGWGCGHALPRLPAGTFNASYIDTLPAGAKITNVKIELLLQQHQGNSVAPTVTMALNGQQIGNTAAIWNYTSCPLQSDLINYTFEQSFTKPFAPYAVKGTNTVSIGVAATCEPYYQCGVNYTTPGGYSGLPGPRVTLTYTTGVEAYVYSGDGQMGATGGPTELPLVVRLASADPSTTLAGKTVEFKITSLPKGASGAAIGADESSTALTYTAEADAQGHAAATFVFGSKEGTYAVEATSPLSNTNVPAQFTISARAPASVRIARRDEGMFDDQYQNPYLVLPLQGARFRAIAYDSAGARIGPIRSDWKTTVPKNETDPGSATLSPSVKSSFARLEPTAFGTLTLEAAPNPKVTGVSAATAPVKISTSVFVDVDGNFNASQPSDDRDWFVPGTASDRTTSVPVPASGSPLQVVRLLVPHPSSAQGKIDLKILESTAYPGIAMNWPPQSQATNSADIYFQDDSQQPTQLLMGVPFHSSGLTAVNLYVNDYGAWARIEVRITDAKTAYPPILLTVPDTDKFSNRIPDVGWAALNSSETQVYEPIENTGFAASADEDLNPTNPAAEIVTRNDGASQPLGLIGDGLSNLQEYRGFVVRGVHRRLNPFQKDLFVLFDVPNASVIASTIAAAGSTNVTVHRLNAEEAKSKPDGTSPEINANRAGVPGADVAQRAVLLRAVSDNAPTRLYMGTHWPIWGVNHEYGAYGLTFYDGMDLTKATQAGDYEGAGHSPNKTQVAEMYPQAFYQFRIYPGANGVLDSIPPCELDQWGCDSYGDNSAYLTPGSDGLMNTRCAGDDQCIGIVRHCLTSEEFQIDWADPFMSQVLAHELGHALNMYHLFEINQQSNVECETIMSYLDTPPASTFTDVERKMVRLHENP